MAKDVTRIAAQKLQANQALPEAMAIAGAVLSPGENYSPRIQTKATEKLHRGTAHTKAMAVAWEVVTNTPKATPSHPLKSETKKSD